MGTLSKAVYTLLLLLGLAFSQSGLTCNAMDYGYAPVSGQVTSPFGWRTDPITGSPRFHGGLDIAAAAGTPVYAPQAGVVMFSGYYGGYGNVVVLNHGNSLYTVYGHNSQLLVQPGQNINRGQPIALVGSTGRSTGPHLHFEVHYNQQYLNPVTYLSYLQQSGPIIAQAAKPAVGMPRTYGASVAGSGTTKRVSVKTVNHRRPAKNRYGNANSVQLVNGTDIKTIEF
ncbi:MAG: Peptidase [Vampirovibrio sp.]|nr:Peptidase [Vampirovibrio sp.]